MAPPQITKLDNLERLHTLLPIIQDYQRFYLGRCLEEDAIVAHFKKFIYPSTKGFLLVAQSEGKTLGFATIYFLPSSLTCREHACMNDLYVEANEQKKGVGKTLIETARLECIKLGFKTMEWMTRDSNLNAQNLYSKFTGDRTLWYYYTLSLNP